jgi:hypothetical protein
MENFSIPPLKFWLSLSSLYIAVSFAFVSAVAIIGIKDIPSKVLISIIGAAGILTVIAWWVSARQEEESGRLRGVLAAIADSVKPADQPDFVASVRRYTPVELRTRIGEFAEDLRQFQSEVNVRRDQQMLRADRQSHDDFVQQLMLENSLTQNQFQTRFRNRAIVFREELNRRLGDVLTGKTDNSSIDIMLTYNSIAGANPFRQLADYLDERARKLR